MCRIMEDMRTESMKEGVRQGIERGAQEEKKMTALRMLKSGRYQLEEIAVISGLPLNEIEKLKTEWVS